MSYCYLCHDALSINLDGSISYSSTNDISTKLYACGSCVKLHGVDTAFDLLEDHYEERASLQSTLSDIDVAEVRRTLNE